MTISTLAQRDAIVRDLEQRMVEAKRRGTFWFPPIATIHAIQRFDRFQRFGI